jgi:two-component system, OmpR family, response regulator
MATRRAATAQAFDSATRPVNEMYAMSHRILIVDDDPHIRQVLSFALGKAGMQTAEAGDGESAIEAIAAQRPDLVVLDINMPKMSGLDVCRRLRAGDDLPILFLSSRDDEIDRVLGLELGGDDYVVKPFSPREVVARVSAILKRGGRALEAAGAQRPISRARLRLDPQSWEAQWDGAPVPVTVTEFQLLLLLASLPSKVFTRDAIIDRLHGPGFAITDRTIDSHIRNLRQKFAGIGGSDLVETRAGIGYRIGPCQGGSA